MTSWMDPIVRWYHRMKWRLKDKRKTVVVTLRLTEPQRVAFEDMMATWNMLGGQGASRYTKFYADGDGDFKPEVRLNGKKPKFTKLLTKDERWPKGPHGDYEIDYDTVAWRLHDEDKK